MLIIEELEKNHIKRLYGINESEEPNTFLLDLIKKGFESADSKTPETTTSKPETTTSKPETTSGYIKLLSNFNSQQKEIINLLIDEMNKSGIRNPFAQIGILSVIDKESGFKTYKEIGYGNTSDERIKSIFGNRGVKCKHLKKDNPSFFECVYGYKSGVSLGNDRPGDGWKYVGRGLNGLTGKYNYKKYGDMIGVDLVSNPELLEQPRISAKVALAFFTRGKPVSSFPNFKTKEEAVNYFADLNAGKPNATFGRGKAMSSSTKFGVTIGRGRV
jgi:predicted chitinase